LDADDLRYVDQLLQDVSGDVDTISDGIVVDHDRDLARMSDFPVPMRRLARVRSVSEARKHHQTLSAERSIGSRIRLGSLECNFGEAGQDRHAATNGFLGETDNGFALGR